MRHLRFWIFDLDGTLTRPRHDFMAVRRHLGIPLDRGILEYIAEQPHARQRDLNDRLAAIERAVAAEAELAPGARTLLERLAELECRLGILTRNSRDCVDITLARTGLSGLFDGGDIVCRDDARPKPDSEGIDRLLARWRAPRELSVMVGDYLFDLQAGRNAGVLTVHYNGKCGETWPDCSDLVVEGFGELTALLVDR